MKKLWFTIGFIAFLSGLIVIALVANPAGPREPEYHGKKLTRWLDDLHTLSTSTATQANARLAIQEMGTNAVPFLVQMLHAKDSSFRRRYMALLERQHWVDFHFHSDRQKQSDAVRGLMILGPDAKAAIPTLADLLKYGNLGEGQTAAFILSRVGPSAVPALEIALTNSNENARYDAAEALGNIAEPSSVPYLLAALKDPDWMIRSRAAEDLRRFPNQADVIVPALINCLDDPDYAFRENVADGLGSYGAAASSAFPKLLKMVASTNDTASKVATMDLAQIDFERTLAAFTNNLNSPDVTVRRTTALALAYFKSYGEPTVPGLVKCLKDPDSEVRENAAVALSEIAADSDLVVPALIKNLSDPDPEVQAATASALGSFGDRAKAAAPQILNIIEESKGDDLRLKVLYKTLSDIDPATAAKLNAK